MSILNSCTNFIQSCFSGDCLLCGAATSAGSLCAPCRSSLPRHDAPACPVCAMPTPAGGVCGHCLQHPPSHQLTVAAFTYSFPVDALIQALKYGGNLAAALPLSSALAQQATRHPRPDLLIPMPLHSARLKQRGFNQSAEIARLMARELGLPLALDLCTRQRDTTPQVALPLKQRHANVKGAFACAADLSGKHVAIVDDVMTSGATLNELAKTLSARGAAQISAWVVARAV